MRPGTDANRIVVHLTFDRPTLRPAMTSRKNVSAHWCRGIRMVAWALAFALLAAACGSADEGQINSEAVGTAIDFDFKDFDGASQRFSDLPEGPVVLNFFASWCSVCIAEMPDFETVHQNFVGDVNFLGLATQDRVENALRLVKDTGVTYPVGNDQNGTIFVLFGGLAMPTTVFLDAGHIVTRVHSGGLDIESLTKIINSDLLS